MIKAIPTTYSNARFRSRLEAKWAAFFDLCGWRWEYEPLDLDGWVPDFGIVGHNGLILCEVKPIEWTQDRKTNEYLLRREDLKKAATASRENLVLGAYPFHIQGEVVNINGVNISTSYIGALFDDMDTYSNFATFSKLSNKLDFRSEYGDFYERISGKANGGNTVEVDISEIDALWREASSRVQWNAKV